MTMPTIPQVIATYLLCVIIMTVTATPIALEPQAVKPQADNSSKAVSWSRSTQTLDNLLRNQVHFDSWMKEDTETINQNPHWKNEFQITQRDAIGKLKLQIEFEILLAYYDKVMARGFHAKEVGKFAKRAEHATAYCRGATSEWKGDGEKWSPIVAKGGWANPTPQQGPLTVDIVKNYQHDIDLLKECVQQRRYHC